MVGTKPTVRYRIKALRLMVRRPVTCRTTLRWIGFLAGIVGELSRALRSDVWLLPDPPPFAGDSKVLCYQTKIVKSYGDHVGTMALIRPFFRAIVKSFTV